MRPWFGKSRRLRADILTRMAQPSSRVWAFTNEPRKAVEVPVRIFGTDHDGKPFSENLITADVSVNGAKLRGLKAKLEPDEIVGLTYGKTKSHFRVKWIGVAGTPTEGLIGLLNLNPTKPFWDFPLPALDSEAGEIPRSMSGGAGHESSVRSRLNFALPNRR